MVPSTLEAKADMPKRWVGAIDLDGFTAKEEEDPDAAPVLVLCISCLPRASCT